MHHPHTRDFKGILKTVGFVLAAIVVYVLLSWLWDTHGRTVLAPMLGPIAESIIEPASRFGTAFLAHLRDIFFSAIFLPTIRLISPLSPSIAGALMENPIFFTIVIIVIVTVAIAIIEIALAVKNRIRGSVQHMVVFAISLVIVAIATTWSFHQFNQAGIFYATGHRLFDHQLYEQSIPYLERAVSLRPSFIHAQSDLGRACLWTGRYTCSRAAFDAILKIQPHDRSARRGIADIMAWTGKRPEAIDTYRQLLKEKPHDVETMRSLADALFWEKRYQEAIPLYRAYLVQDPFHRMTLVNLAEALSQSGHKDEAAVMFADLEQRYPDYPPALVAIGRYHLEQKDYGTARSYYRKALDIDADNIEAQMRLADCLFAEGHRDDAIELLGNAVMRHPDDIVWHLARANFLLWSQRYAEAERAFTEIRKRWPDDPVSLRGLAYVFAWQGEYRKALPLLEESYSSNQEDPEVVRELALGYLAAGRAADAVRLYDKILADSAPPPETLMNAAQAYAAAGKTAKAATIARDVLSREPGNYTANALLVDLAIRGRRFADAERMLRRMLAANPRNKRLHEKLGDVLMWQGKFSEAQREYERNVGPAPKE